MLPYYEISPNVIKCYHITMLLCYHMLQYNVTTCHYIIAYFTSLQHQWKISRLSGSSCITPCSDIPPRCGINSLDGIYGELHMFPLPDIVAEAIAFVKRYFIHLEVQLDAVSALISWKCARSECWWRFPGLVVWGGVGGGGGKDGEPHLREKLQRWQYSQNWYTIKVTMFQMLPMLPCYQCSI